MKETELEVASKDWSFWRKISFLQWAAQTIKKEGFNNTFGKYKKFGNIKEALMQLMRELHLAVTPTNMHLTPEQMNYKEVMNTYTNKKGNHYSVTEVTYIQEFKITNGDKPEQFETFFHPMDGTNGDGGDKANGSAVTYALKYILNMVGMVPDETLDPDDEQRTDKGDKRTPTTTNKGANQAINNKPEQLNVKLIVDTYNDPKLKEYMITDRADKLFMTANDHGVVQMTLNTLNNFSRESIKTSLANIKAMQAMTIMQKDEVNK